MGNTCKYYKQQKRISYDSGITWTYLDEYRQGELYESNSSDCGGGTTMYRWVNLDPSTEYYCDECSPLEIKFSATYSGGQTYSAACDDNSILTSGETRLNGYQYSAMTSAEIGDCVTSINALAFYYCVSLSGITIPSGVTSIASRAFYNCTSLNGITVNATRPPMIGYNVFDNTNNCPIYVPCESVDTYKRAWSDYADRIQGIPPCSPSGIKIQATYSNEDIYRKYCYSSAPLTSGDTRPSGYQYSAMTSVEIGDCVTSIGDGAFRSCTSLTSVTIPNSVTSIDYYVFYNCTSLSSVTIPNSVTSIGDNVFEGCTSLTSVNIPSGVTSIGERAFYRCIKLTSVTIPNSVTSIGIYAYSFCFSLSSVAIPNSVTSIGNGAFYNCTSLTSVTIPNSVTSIGDSAFEVCSGLTNITVNALTPPTLGYKSFDKTNNCPIYVPSASVSAYKSSWSDYASRIQPIP